MDRKAIEDFAFNKATEDADKFVARLDATFLRGTPARDLAADAMRSVSLMAKQIVMSAMVRHVPPDDAVKLLAFIGDETKTLMDSVVRDWGKLTEQA